MQTALLLNNTFRCMEIKPVTKILNFIWFFFKNPACIFNTAVQKFLFLKLLILQ